MTSRLCHAEEWLINDGQGHILATEGGMIKARRSRIEMHLRACEATALRVAPAEASQSGAQGRDRNKHACHELVTGSPSALRFRDYDPAREGPLRLKAPASGA